MAETFQPRDVVIHDGADVVKFYFSSMITTDFGKELALFAGILSKSKS